MEGSFGQVARLGVVDQGQQWYDVHLYCKCMAGIQVGILSLPISDGFEVKWAEDEIILLSDEEALSLMEQHVCS